MIPQSHQSKPCAPTAAAGYVVCGWYTPDYAHWLPALQASLDRHGAPHDFVETTKAIGGWEANTMRKAHEVLRAMDRHSDKAVVFIDVDCEVRAPLTRLAEIAADVAFYVRVRRRRNGALKWGIRSGTLVLSPTQGARRFVENWIEETNRARYGDVDQTTLQLAFARTPWVTFHALPVAYCATAGDKVPEPVMLHDQASRSARKLKSLTRWFGQALASVRPPASAPEREPAKGDKSQK